MGIFDIDMPKQTTRRSMIGAIGATSIALFAGCMDSSEGDGDDGESSNEETDSESERIEELEQEIEDMEQEIDDPKNNAIQPIDERIDWFDPGEINNGFDQEWLLNDGDPYQGRITDVEIDDAVYVLTFQTQEPFDDEEREVSFTASSLELGVVEEDPTDDIEFDELEIILRRGGENAVTYTVDVQWLLDYHNALIAEEFETLDELEDEVVESYQQLE